MRNWEIPLFKIFWDEEDVCAVGEVVRKGVMWTDGEKVREFERKIAEYMGSRYCVCFNSGTSALHAALFSCGVGKGDEVIVPSFTFIATCNAPLFVGAKPVFVDIEEETLGIDPGDFERKITDKTKAVIPVHYAGIPCKIEKIREIARRYNILVIEDAAEAFGVRIGEKKAGTFGNAGVLSFCQNKIITTGEGGAVVTDSKKICHSLKLIRSHGREEKKGYFYSSDEVDYVTLGYNFRMSEINASLGLSQLKKVDRIIEKRRKMAEIFREKIKNIKEIKVISSPERSFCVYQMLTILVEDEKKRNRLSLYLSKRGIMTKIYFTPVHLTSFFKNTLGYKCKLPVTEEISGKVLTLPLYPSMKEEEMGKIADCIKKFFSGQENGKFL